MVGRGKLRLNNISSLIEAIVAAHRLVVSLIGPKAIRLIFYITWFDAVDGPIAKKVALENKHIKLNLHFHISRCSTKVPLCIFRRFEFKAYFGGVGGMAPFKWPDGRPIESPVIHRFIGCSASVKEAEIQPLLFRLFTVAWNVCVDGRGFLDRVACGPRHVKISLSYWVIESSKKNHMCDPGLCLGRLSLNSRA